MSHAVVLQFREQGIHPRCVQMFHHAATTGDDEPQGLRVGLQQPGHELAAVRLEVAQHAHLVVEALRGIGAMELFDDPTIEGQVHGGAQRIFDFQHFVRPMESGDLMSPGGTDMESAGAGQT